MTKKGPVLEDLRKTFSNLVEERNEYEKYGEHLKQEISDLIVANEKLLSCLKDRRQAYINFSNKDNQFDNLIDNKSSEISKKKFIRDKISFILNSKNRASTISSTIKKSQLRYRSVHRKLKQLKKSSIGQILLLSEKKKRLEKENEILQNEIDKLKSILDDKTNQNEIPADIAEDFETFRKKTKENQEKRKERSEVKLEKFQISPSSKINIEDLFPQYSQKESDNSTQEKAQQNQSDIKNNTDLQKESENIANSKSQNESEAANTKSSKQEINSDSKLSQPETLLNPLIKKPKDKYKASQIPITKPVISHNPKKFVSDLDVSDTNLNFDKLKKKDSKNDILSEKSGTGDEKRQKNGKKSETNDEDSKTDHKKSDKKNISSQPNESETETETKSKKKDNEKNSSNSKKVSPNLESESDLILSNELIEEEEEDIEDDEDDNNNNKATTKGQMSADFVFQLLELELDSNTSIPDVLDICDSEYKKKRRHKKEKEEEKMQKLFEKATKKAEAKIEAQKKEEEEKKKKEEEEKKKKEEEEEKKKKEEEEKKKEEEEKKKKEEEEKKKKLEEEERKRKEEEEEEERKKKINVEPLVTRSDVEQYKKRDDDSSYDSLGYPKYDYYDYYEEEEEEDEFEEEEDFVFLFQRKVQTNLSMRSMKSDALTEELNRIQRNQELTNQISKHEYDLNDIEADLLELTKKSDLKRMKIESLCKRLNISRRFPTISVPPHRKRKHCNVGIEAILTDDIDTIKQKINDNMGKTSQKFLFFQTKRDLESSLMKLGIETKLIKNENAKKESEYNELMSKLKIIDPFQYNIEADIEQPESKLAPDLQQKKIKRQKLLQRIQNRIDLFLKRNKDLENQISDIKYVIKQYKGQLYQKGKQPHLQIRPLCNKFRSDRNVFQDISRQTSFINIEAGFIQNQISDIQQKFGDQDLRSFSDQISILENELNQIKFKYNSAHGHKGKRSVVMTNRAELTMFQQKIGERINEVDVCKMKMSGMIVVLEKQMKAAQNLQIKLPEPPEAYNTALALTKKRAQSTKMTKTNVF